MRDKALAQAVSSKTVRTASHSLSNISLSVQQESPSRPVLLWFYKYTAMQTGQRKRKLGRNVRFAQVKLLQVSVLMQSSDSYIFRHALNFLFFN